MQYSNPEEDKKYSRWGVEPPERLPHLTDEERETVFEKFRTGHTHRWRQQGNRIFCDIGEFEHGNIIPTQKMLIGTDSNGLPKLQNVVISR